MRITYVYAYIPAYIRVHGKVTKRQVQSGKGTLRSCWNERRLLTMAKAKANLQIGGNILLSFFRQIPAVSQEQE